MRVIVVGSRTFGAAALGAIAGNHEVVAVWAPEWEDKLARAGRALEAVPVIYGHVPGRDLEQMGWDADLFVCAHSHAFLSARARATTKLGAIGYHPSLLPRHRGRDAVEWTVRMGDPVAGGSVYWFTDGIDQGPIAAQEHVLVRPGMTASELWRESLFPLGIELLMHTLADLDRGTIREVPQDERCATWEPSLDVEPLFRPDLVQIGRGPEGFEVEVTLR